MITFGTAAVAEACRDLKRRRDKEDGEPHKKNPSARERYIEATTELSMDLLTFALRHRDLKPKPELP
jgi:hypothetical protein